MSKLNLYLFPPPAEFNHSSTKSPSLPEAGFPRETVRRKKIKLIKNKFIILNKKKKSYRLNKGLIDKKILEPQIEISSKMLLNCCNFFSNKNVFSKELDLVSFKNDIEKKFNIYLPIFLNFQISYITQWRKFFDMECLFIEIGRAHV